MGPASRALLAVRSPDAATVQRSRREDHEPPKSGIPKPRRTPRFLAKLIICQSQIGYQHRMPRLGLLGLIMAFGIPVLAWVENSALFLLLIATAVLGFVAVLWWYWRERGK